MKDVHAFRHNNTCHLNTSFFILSLLRKHYLIYVVVVTSPLGLLEPHDRMGLLRYVVGASTTSVGREFQGLTILSENAFTLIFDVGGRGRGGFLSFKLCEK